MQPSCFFNYQLPIANCQLPPPSYAIGNWVGLLDKFIARFALFMTNEEHK